MTNRSALVRISEALLAGRCSRTSVTAASEGTIELFLSIVTFYCGNTRSDPVAVIRRLAPGFDPPLALR